MHFEVYATISTFDTAISKALNNSEDFDDGYKAWDLTQKKLNSGLYLRHTFFDMEKENDNSFKMIWKLETSENIENKETVYEGIVKQLDMLESSLNAEYHLVDSDLIKPKASLEITNVFVNDEPVKSDLFDDFNSRNNDIKEKLLRNVKS